MLGKLLVTPVQHSFVPGVGRRCCLAVIRNEQPENAAEIRKSVYMAQKPALLLHVAAGFRIGVPTAGQDGHEDGNCLKLAGNRFRPLADRKLGCDGMITLSAATSASIVIIPREGMQSIRI